MNNYQHPTENRVFYSPDREPTVDLGVTLWRIAGLDNFSKPRPANLVKNATANSARATGSGPSGYFIGSDMRAAYYGGTLTGSGQSVGLLEFEGYNISDVTNYFTKVKQTFNSMRGGPRVCGWLEHGLHPKVRRHRTGPGY